MQVLTPSGYIDINDLNIGDEVIAYDINDGHVIINILEGKNKWTYDMFPAVPPVYELDAEGNIVYDEDGNPIVLEPGKTSEEVFQETYGDWKFYKINDTWTLFCNQSIWANGNVTHASELQIGDIIYDDQDQDITITSIEEVDAPYWWRLDISGDHSYIADDLTLHNASRYWVGGGSSANWNATANTNWGSTSGGTNNASVPTSADDVTFDGAGTNGNTNSTISAAINILSLNITTGYTATMTHNAVLTISGNWTYTGNYTIAGTSAVNINAASTITSNGTTWPNALTFTNTNTKTLSGNLTVSGLLTISNVTTLTQTTSETLTCSGGITVNSTLSGTAKVILTGGTWSGTNTTGMSNNLDINGNVTISGNVYYGAGTLTYVSGTVTTTGSTLILTATLATTTLNTNGIAWNNVTSSNPKTVILTSNFLINGLFSTGATNSFTTINSSTSETMTVAGGMSLPQALTGSAKIILTGGTWSGPAYTSNNLDLNGNITVSGDVGYRTNTITYVSGTITTTGSTLNCQASCTLNTNGVTWNNFTLNGTVTLISNLLINGSYVISNANTINSTTSQTVTINGGITVNNTHSGTAKIILTGGTWSGSNTTGIANNIDINGNVTVSGIVYYRTGTLTYISGTVTTTGSTLNITASCTLNTNGITWNNIISNASSKTIILTSDLNVSGLTTISGTTNLNRTTAEVANLNGGIQMSGNLTSFADIYLKGGSWSGTNPIRSNVFFDGNVLMSGTTGWGSRSSIDICTLKYLSGNVNFNAGSQIFAINNVGSVILDTKGVFWMNVEIEGGGTNTQTLLSDLVIMGEFRQRNSTININKTTNETVTIYGGIAQSVNIRGTADIYLKGGVWRNIQAQVQDIENNLYIDGPVTISGTVQFSNAGTGISGRTFQVISGPVKTINASLVIDTSCNILGFNKVSLNSVLIRLGRTVTMDQFFCGTPSRACVISSTGTNYTIAFQDGFEKIAKNVQISGATISRPQQLLVINNSRFNTNRSTNTPHIRYYNQSPNGVPKNKPSIDDTMTVPALGLVGDPCFQYS